jgi:hypothetical protein
LPTLGLLANLPRLPLTYPGKVALIANSQRQGKDKMERLLAGLVVCLLVSGGVARAANEASFDFGTGTLHIPKVAVGSEYYEVVMQRLGEGLDFSVTAAAPSISDISVNVVSYNSDTGVVHIPKVVVGADVYAVDMQKEGQGLDFTVTGAVVAESYRIPDTGQTISYTAISGEDADYTINPPSYTNHGNGTMTDNVTGLMWQREDDGATRTWSDAVVYCESLGLAGYADWRLPSLREMVGIVDYGRFSPAINSAAFPNTGLSEYWSYTTDASNGSYAWCVDFNLNGVVGINLKSDNRSVRCRCVR